MTPSNQNKLNPDGTCTVNPDDFLLPPVGGDPGTEFTTTPGSFANPAVILPGVRGAKTYSSPDTPGMPAPSTKTAWDFLPIGWTTSEEETPRSPRSATVGVETVTFTQADGSQRSVTHPNDFSPVTQLESARLGIITPQMNRVAQREPHLSVEQIRDEIAAGRMVIPANTVALNYGLDPMAIGRASKTKINANMGASPVSSSMDEEIEKLKWAEQWGADTVMDLSTGGDLDATRVAIIQNSTVPIGTVPIYSMILDKKIEDLNEQIILDSVKLQASQGVSYFTIHAGIKREHVKYAKDRFIGLVSRGGSLLAKWMIHHGKENPFNTAWEKICAVMRDYDITFSIGDGCRPGGLSDATDTLQLAELVEIAKLTERAWRCGIQVMVEGPGHVPLDQVEYNMKIERTLCHGAPFYVLGPLVTDVFPGYDHITSAIGATNAAYHGASMLCYVTPKEHLGLPKKSDVKEGCVAYKIAAHAADIALGIPGTRDWDDELTKARAALNWEKHFELAFDTDTARAYHDEDMDVDTDFCAMCGHDWCSVRISKEIQEWASGNAEGFERNGDGRTVKSDALTPEQQKILEQRGYLSPQEIHKLAAKKKKKLSPAPGTSEGEDSGAAPSCHSDTVDPKQAEQLKQQELVQLNTHEVHGLSKHDSMI